MIPNDTLTTLRLKMSIEYNYTFQFEFTIGDVRTFAVLLASVYKVK